MRVLIVNSYFSSVGGAEVVAYDTYKALQRKNNEVFFFALDKKPFFEENYEYAKYFPKNKFTTLEYIKNPIRYYYDKNSTSKLKEFIKAIKPDIIHLHNILGFSPLILEACKNIPSILTIHQADIICPSGTLMHKSKELCSQRYCRNSNYLYCILNNCANNNIERTLRRSLLTYLYNKKLNNIDKYITPSYALKDVVVKANIGIQNEDITVINNFLPQLSHSELPKFSKGKNFLYVGRLSKEKDVMTLLKAFKELPPDIKLHIAGSGQEEKKLKRFVRDNKLSNVKFLGFLNREQVNQELNNCIATILPCNWFEIFGMTNIESLIKGKPVIGSNVGGIPEIVENNVNGLLFEPTNIEQLKVCILTYWNNSELAIEHGKNGYKKAITQYTEERYYDELMKVYEETINESRK